MSVECPVDIDIGPYSDSTECQNPLRGAVEIIPDRLYYCALSSSSPPPTTSEEILLHNHRQQKIPVKCFTVDEELVYLNFFLDFGPLNLGQLYRFTVKLNNLLLEQNNNTLNKNQPPVLLFYSSTDAEKRVNAIYLICAWQVLELKRTPEQAFFAFQYYLDHKEHDPPKLSTSLSSSRRRRCSVPPPTPLTTIGKETVAPLPPFHDASPYFCDYDLTLLDCLEGLVKARQHQFFNWEDFDVDEYEFFEKVKNGDLNWIIQNKILAFAGPTYERTETPGGYGTLAPADYIPYFKSRNVGLVVRLNEKTYDEQDFVKAGIEHLEEIYLDGSCPPLRMLQRVIQALEAVPSDKAFALHCRAGLGRTGTCIGAYMMKHYRLTAANVISWMRICRPGMVIGPQQQFLVNLEPVMWQEGEMLKVTTSCLSLPAMCRNSGQKRTSGNSADKGPEAEVPLDPPPWAAHRAAAAADAITGRPGQAEALLARRRKRQNTTVVSAGPSSTTSLPPPTTTTTTTIPSAEGPVLITPDSIAGTKSQGFAEDDL